MEIGDVAKIVGASILVASFFAFAFIAWASWSIDQDVKAIRRDEEINRSMREDE